MIETGGDEPSNILFGEPGWVFLERRYLTRIPPDIAAG
jgi:hypothetical protein